MFTFALSRFRTFAFYNFPRLLDGDRRVEGSIRHPAHHRHRRSIRFGIARPVGSLRHGGPRHPSSASENLIPLIQGHRLRPHLYADDTQVYGSCRPSASLELQNTITNCVNDVASWTRSNRLQLNSTKTEILWSATSRCSCQLSQSSLPVCTDKVLPATVVCNLGIYIDSDVSMRSQVTKTVSSCFAYCVSCDLFAGLFPDPSSRPW